jgi:hypothetical protein
MKRPEEGIRKALYENDTSTKVAYQLVVDHKRLLKDCKLLFKYGKRHD